MQFLYNSWSIPRSNILFFVKVQKLFKNKIIVKNFVYLYSHLFTFIKSVYIVFVFNNKKGVIISKKRRHAQSIASKGQITCLPSFLLNTENHGVV